MGCPEVARDECWAKAFGFMFEPVLGLRRAKRKHRFGLVSAGSEECLETVSLQCGLFFCDFVTVHNQFLVMGEP